ncbi:MAG: hypothetical protein ACI9TO_000138 [Rickettsiales bacterium]|jgi:hypothetical protein
MIKKIFIISLIIFTASCGRFWYKPYGKIFDLMPKGGSPGFELGWAHGCESGLGTQFGGAVYQSFYAWKKDPEISKAVQTPEDIAIIRGRYVNEKIAHINWNNPNEVGKNFSDYKTVFWQAHIFCRHSVLGQLQMSDMVPPVAGDVRYDPGASGIGNIYKIDGKGDARLSYW